jgi:hypothetical protein
LKYPKVVPQSRAGFVTTGFGPRPKACNSLIH